MGCPFVHKKIRKRRSPLPDAIDPVYRGEPKRGMRMHMSIIMPIMVLRCCMVRGSFPKFALIIERAQVLVKKIL